MMPTALRVKRAAAAADKARFVLAARQLVSCAHVKGDARPAPLVGSAAAQPAAMPAPVEDVPETEIVKDQASGSTDTAYQAFMSEMSGLI